MKIKEKICPECGLDLKKIGVTELQTCEVKWFRIWNEEEKDFKVIAGPDGSEIYDGLDSDYTCANCGHELTEAGE